MVLILALPLVLIVGATAYAVKKHSTPNHVDTTYLQNMKVPKDSLFSIFQPLLVSIGELRSRGYSSVLSLVQLMIGVQPTCDMVLEIWKPCFESYNIIVPNFLNFPQVLFGAPGSADSKLVSLAMYASSRANECAYCTSHTCSFALRRGVDPSILKNLLDEMNGKGTGELSREESVTVKLSYGLGTVPCSLNAETVKEAYEIFSQDTVEWLVAATAMFGAFNKLMDGLNIPLEFGTYQETVESMDPGFAVGAAGGMVAAKKLEGTDNTHRAPVPEKDDWTNYLAVLYHGLRPGGALALDAKLLKGIPTKYEDCKVFLEDLCGSAFPSALKSLRHDRFRRGIVGVVAKNFVSDNVPLNLKAQVGLKYCEIIENESLGRELQDVLQFTTSADDTDEDFTKLVLRVGTALSYSPSRMTPRLVQEIKNSSQFSPVKVVELVSFLATLQMLHRVVCLYERHPTPP